MKHFRLLLTLLTLTIGWTNASAQTWTGSEVADGTFYLYNVGAKGYLIGANNWGTRASVADQGGIIVTLALKDGAYSISTAPTYANLFLGGNGYVDRPESESAWTFTPIEGQTNVYKLSCSAGTLFVDTQSEAYTLGTTPTSVGTDPDNDYSLWMLISKEERLNNLSNATSDNPYDATFLLTNPNFGKNTNGSGWTMNSTNYNSNGGNDINCCAESWKASFTLSQTISVPNGYYKVRAQAALTDYSGAYDGTDYPVVYLNDASVPFNNMDDTDRGTSMTQLSNSFNSGKYFTDYTDVVTAASNSLTVGVKGTRADTWCIWDNFQLLYLGPIDLTEYANQLAAAVAAAEAIEGTIPAAVYQQIATVVSENNKEYETADEYSAAISAINNAVAQYATNDIKNAYSRYQVVRNAAAALDDDATKYTGDATVDVSAPDAAVEQATTVAAIDEQIPNVRTIAATFISAITLNEGQSFDLTDIWVENAYFEGTTAGWTLEAPLGGNIGLKDGVAMEYWAGTASDRSNASFNIHQTISGLPVGAYTISADMFNSLNGEEGAVFSPTCGIYGIATNEAISLVDVDGTTLIPYTTDEVKVTTDNITIGAKNAVTPIAARWFLFDNVKLTYTRKLTDEELNKVPTSITLSETELTLRTVDKATLTATISPEDATDKTITWASSDETIATVSDGVISPVSAGTVTITATAVAGDNVSASATVTIVKAEAVIADGYYFLRDSQGRYVGRGSSYNTRAIMEDFGLPVKVATNENGFTTFTFIDSNQNLFDAGSKTVYTDNTTYPYWRVEPTEGGYLIINKNNNGSYDLKLGTDGGTWMQSNETGLVWTFEPAAEHNTHMEALKDKQAKEVAQAAGIAAETKAALNEILNSNEYMAEKIDIDAVPWGEKYQVSAGDEGAGNGVKYYENSVSGLKPGLYKLTAKAFYRLTWNEAVDAAAGARGNVYLYGNNAKTQLYSVFDFPADAAWVSGNDYQDANGKFYPNNPTGGQAAFSAGNYENELFVYVNADEGAETGTLSYGIHQPSRFGKNGQWCGYQDFTLTRYSNEVSAEDAQALIASIPTDAMSKADKEAIAAAKTALEAEANVANYNALDAAIKAAAPSIEAYKTYAYYVEACKANNAEAARDIEVKYEEGVIESAEAIVAEFRTNVLATLGTDKVTDYTSVIINPGFETGPFLVNEVTGWEVNKNAGEAFASNSNASRAFTPGYVGNGLFNTWYGSEFWLRQNLGILPKGAYRMTAYISSAAGNEYTVKAGTGSATVTTTDGKVGTPVSVTFVSDGTTATAIDITTDKWFKADDFHLTLIGSELANASAIAEDVVAIAEKLGFEEGEYAPYNNVESMKALEAIAETVLNAEGQIGNYETVAITEAINTLTWTANTEEVNAVYDGNFALAQVVETSTDDEITKGWSNPTGIRQVIGTIDSFPGLADASAGKAVFSWSGTYNYGGTTGYTMPLKAETTYKFTIKYTGWSGQNLSNGADVYIYAPDGSTLATEAMGAVENNIANENSLKTYTLEFKTGMAGNYVLGLNPKGNWVFTDVSIFKAKAKKGDVNGDGNVDVADVTALVNAIAKGEQPAAGNLDGVEGVDADDVKALVELVLKEE